MWQISPTTAKTEITATKVGELIAALSKLEPDLDVLCYSDGGSFVSTGQKVVVLHINSVDVSEAERSRVDGAPQLKFGRSDLSEKLVFLNATSDF